MLNNYYNYHKLVKIFFNFVLILFLNQVVHADDKIYDIKGMDWRLDKAIKVSKYGSVWGNFGEENEPDYITTSFVIADWKKINPTTNTFNFSSIDKDLKRLAPRSIILRVNWYSECATPKWVLKKVPAMSENTLVFWHPAYKKSLTPLVKALAKKYANHPQVKGIYLGLGDGKMIETGNCKSAEDGWGEFWMTEKSIQEAEKYFDFSPKVLQTTTINLLDMFANAFAKNRGKLALTNVERFVAEVMSPYNQALIQAMTYARKIGIGMRDGSIENWGQFIHPAYGTKLTIAKNHTCRLSTNETFAKTLGNRYWGDENEFYGTDDYILDSMGPYTNQAYRFYVSSFRSLQMRKNYVAVSPQQILALPASDWKAADLLKYLSKTYGRSIENTPDAFTMLGERYIAAETLVGNFYKNCIHDNQLNIRGIERWLSEIGESEATMKIKMPADEKYWGQSFMPEDINYEYAARKSNQFHFVLHDELIATRCPNGCDVAIKISYLSDQKTSIWLETQDEKSKKFNTTVDGKIHTLTFPIFSQFNHTLDKKADFIIHSRNKPLSIIFARVVFTTNE